MAKASPEYIAPEPMFDLQNPVDSAIGMLPVHAQWLNGINIGDTLSPRLGNGSERDGVRPYEVGDDPRQIDWQITARDPSGWPQIRKRQMDITPSLYIVTDGAQSRFESCETDFSLSTLALSVTMALAQMAQRQGTPTSIIAAGDERIAQSPFPKVGRPHIYETATMLGDLVTEQRARRPRLVSKDPEAMMKDHIPLADLFSHAARIATDSAVVVVSNFRDTLRPNGWDDQLASIADRNNDLTVLEIREPDDLQLPKLDRKYWLGRRELADLGGKQESGLREEYARIAKQREGQISEALAGIAIGHMEMTTTDPFWLTSLRQQLRNLSRSAKQAF